jgi:SAM-dependent methyltransferase
MNSLSINTWEQYARQWSHLGQPLRPNPQDTAFTRKAISEWYRTRSGTAPSLLILGVTPELCGLPMNGGSRVIAVDKSANMICSVWPGRLRVRDEAICADWLRMPLAASSIDLALGDGCLTALTYPLGYSALFSELRRVLSADGRCIIRCFVQPENRETPDDVFADLFRGRIGNFHVLKWRLAMALQSDFQQGVAVQNVWSLLEGTWPGLDRLAERFGWPIEECLTIRAYRNVDTRYVFLTRAQHCEFFSRAGFSVVQVATQSYELGERCPTFVLEPLTGVAP